MSKRVLQKEHRMIFKKQTGILLLLLLAIGCTNTEIVIQ
jgi:hypothetical protein